MGGARGDGSSGGIMTVAVSTASKIRDDILPATLVGKASGKRAPHVRLQFCIRQGEKSCEAKEGGGGGGGGGVFFWGLN
jgi:hypothetical protein